MSEIDFSSALTFSPEGEKPCLLFVLLHGEAAGPEQLFPLVDAIKDAYPLAMMILPPADAASHLDELAAFVRQVQERHKISGEQTALAGFSQGARMALELSRRHVSLAGRVLAFSGLYAEAPAAISQTTMIHLFHGANDRLLPLREVQAMMRHLNTIQADATVDIASHVGHELHPALIDQAIVRLQTCVPLRIWQAAFSELHRSENQENGGSDDISNISPIPPTLH